MTYLCQSLFLRKKICYSLEYLVIDLEIRKTLILILLHMNNTVGLAFPQLELISQIIFYDCNQKTNTECLNKNLVSNIESINNLLYIIIIFI
jgi:peptide deformylase